MRNPEQMKAAIETIRERVSPEVADVLDDFVEAFQTIATELVGLGGNMRNVQVAFQPILTLIGDLNTRVKIVESEGDADTPEEGHTGPQLVRDEEEEDG